MVAPTTFNTVNKVANGITDTLAVGLICEAIGAGKPVIIAPWMNRALASHSAHHRSLDYLAADGVRLVHTEVAKPTPVRSPDEADSSSALWPLLADALVMINKGGPKVTSQNLSRMFGMTERCGVIKM